jgi:hypothetical protein
MNEFEIGDLVVLDWSSNLEPDAKAEAVIIQVFNKCNYIYRVRVNEMFKFSSVTWYIGEELLVNVRNLTKVPATTRTENIYERNLDPYL